MLTEHEQRFVEYWEANRLSKKKVLRQLYVGLPLSCLFVIAIVANFFSGWYKRADMEIRADPSLFLVILIAAILIIMFITIFSARHKWEMNEQQYREFLSKKDNP